MCRWQVTPKHAYTLDPTKSEWADYAAVQIECGNLSGNELTRNSSENTRSLSSQLAEPLWTDPGLKNGISVREPISTLKKIIKKAQARNELSNILPKSSHTRKKPLPLVVVVIIIIIIMAISGAPSGRTQSAYKKHCRLTGRGRDHTEQYTQLHSCITSYRSTKQTLLSHSQQFLNYVHNK